MNELEIQTDIIDFLRSTFRGCICWKIEDAKTRGIPDIYFAFKGSSAWFEVKSKSGRVHPLQTYINKRLNNNGIPANIVRSVADVKKILIDKLAILP